MKLKITESQLKKIKKTIKEGINSDEDKYKKDVKFSFYYDKNLTFKGLPVNDVTNIEGTVYFDIYMEYKSWGVKVDGVYNVKGYDTIEIEIETYDGNMETYELNMNWEDKVKLNSNELSQNSKLITIDEDVNVYLINDNEGNIVVDYIDVETMP